MVLNDPSALNALKNTLILVLTVPTITMLVAVLILVRGALEDVRASACSTCWRSCRTAAQHHDRPGLVYLFLTVPWRWSAIYGTVWIIMLAVVTRYLAFGSRTMHGAVLQIHQDLEEAAQVGGVSWRKAFRYIVLPLLFPAIVSGWVFVGCTP